MEDGNQAVEKNNHNAADVEAFVRCLQSCDEFEVKAHAMCRCSGGSGCSGVVVVVEVVVEVVDSPAGRVCGRRGLMRPTLSWR